MRVLVTGADGFVGRYATQALERHGHTVVPMDVRSEAPDGYAVDLSDRTAVRKLVEDVRPDACLHLGAISFVPEGNRDPGAMLTVNVAGTVNLLDAFRELAPEARILVVSSAQVYGPIGHDQPIGEDHPLRPTTLYAMSKAAADTGALGYAATYGMPVLTVRPGNHTGPGQPPQFVVPSFVRQADLRRETAAGEIRVGNLACIRDFTDVRDVAEAYVALLERGRAGQAYNLSANVFLRIGEILDMICRQAGIAPHYTVDPSLLRPTDRSAHLDTTRLNRNTGWRPSIPLEQTIADMLQCP